MFRFRSCITTSLPKKTLGSASSFRRECTRIGNKLRCNWRELLRCKRAVQLSDIDGDNLGEPALQSVQLRREIAKDRVRLLGRLRIAHAHQHCQRGELVVQLDWIVQRIA